ncbi:LysM peptidoglycan-binding domain-containing protein [Bacteroidota bacterium]
MTKELNYKNFIKRLKNKLGKKKKTEKSVSTLFKLIKNNLIHEGEVSFPGLGRFYLDTKKVKKNKKPKIKLRLKEESIQEKQIEKVRTPPIQLERTHLFPRRKRKVHSNTLNFVLFIGIVIIALLAYFFYSKTVETVKEGAEEIIEEYPVQKIEESEISPVEKVDKIENKKENMMIHHIVKEYETLWAISKKYYKNAYLWPVLYFENRQVIKNPDFIRPGLKLQVNPFDSMVTFSKQDSLRITDSFTFTYRQYNKQNANSAHEYLWVANKYTIRTTGE